MKRCEYEDKNGRCTLNECMYGDFLVRDDSQFDIGRYCYCNGVTNKMKEQLKERRINKYQEIAQMQDANAIQNTVDAYAKGRHDMEKELNALGECEYNKGRVDAFKECAEKIDDILTDKSEMYGGVCREAYTDAYIELEYWIKEQNFEKTHECETCIYHFADIDTDKKDCHWEYGKDGEERPCEIGGE